jgi:hypothetical protein
MIQHAAIPSYPSERPVARAYPRMPKSWFSRTCERLQGKVLLGLMAALDHPAALRVDRWFGGDGRSVLTRADEVAERS